MSELTPVPTVEQINLEHRLANSKASEAIQHATHCGLMLLQVKASLAHGEWLPWLNGEIESGRLIVKVREAQNYMRLASNTQRVAYLEEAPSIRAALELLSDKEPTEQQSELGVVESERQARQEAEAKAESERQARLTAEQRSEDWRQQSNGQRKKIRDLEQQIDLLQARSAEPVTVIPDDYEALKQTERDLRNDLADLRQKQRELVQQQVAEKLAERETELEEIDQKVRAAAARLEGLQNQIDRYTLRQRELKVHLDVIEEARTSLATLAANLSGFQEVIDDDHERRQWVALSDMMRHGAAVIDQFVSTEWKLRGESHE